MRTPRRRSREFALQGLYQALLNPDYTAGDIIANIKETDAFVKAAAAEKPRVDTDLFTRLLSGVLADKSHGETTAAAFLERRFAEVNLIERAILLLAHYELANSPETPAAVIINEAIELTKVYAQEDSYRFINGAVDKMAQTLRPDEFTNSSNPIRSA